MCQAAVDELVTRAFKKRRIVLECADGLPAQIFQIQLGLGRRGTGGE